MKRNQSSAQAVDISLRLDWATHEAATYACRYWHYSKSVPCGKLVKIGVWEDSKFTGVIIFSHGANNNACKYFSLSQQSVCELTRVALKSHVTPVSRLVSIAIKLLKQKCPGIRLIFSYSDKTNKNHHGGIYQAGGWKYLGERSTASKGAYYCINGKKMHGRSARAKYGHESRFPIGWAHWPSETKHLYIKIIDPKYIDTHKEFKYPKRAVSIKSDVPVHQTGDGGAIPTTALRE